MEHATEITKAVSPGLETVAATTASIADPRQQDEICRVREEALSTLRQIEGKSFGTSLELMQVVSNLQNRLRYAQHNKHKYHNYRPGVMGGKFHSKNLAPYISWMDARAAQQRSMLVRSRTHAKK